MYFNIYVCIYNIHIVLDVLYISVLLIYTIYFILLNFGHKRILAGAFQPPHQTAPRGIPLVGEPQVLAVGGLCTTPWKSTSYSTTHRYWLQEYGRRFGDSSGGRGWAEEVGEKVGCPWLARPKWGEGGFSSFKKKPTGGMTIPPPRA